MMVYMLYEMDEYNSVQTKPWNRSGILTTKLRGKTHGKSQDRKPVIQFTSLEYKERNAIDKGIYWEM